jgi:hypothetical protein
MWSMQMYACMEISVNLLICTINTC